MKAPVLDASAVLALLQAEPGSEQVEALLPGATMSAVNLAEVAGKLHGSGMPEETIRHAVGALGVEIIPCGEEDAYDTGFLYPRTYRRGLSLGDRACLALGLRLNRPVVTADQTWKRLELGLEIYTIR